MGAFDKCKPSVEQAAGRPLSEREMAELYDALKRHMKEKRAETASREDALVGAADAFANDVKLAAIIEKRNAAMNLRRRIEAVHYVTTRFADKPIEGIEALLVGVNRARQGARASVASEQRALAGKYLAGFVADIEKLGPDHAALLASGELDRDIARALWALDNDDAPSFTGPKQAADIAGAIRKWQEVARTDANRAGAWIGKLPGYIVRQTHDLFKIRAAGFAQWKADILPRLDLSRTVDGDVDAFLRAVFNGLSSGVHLKASAASEKAAGFKGPANLAKRLSAERALHFKDADAWADYNAMYGSGSLRESLLSGLERTAHSTAMMRTLGTNPAAMVDSIIAEVERTLADNPEGLRKLSEARRMLDNRLAEIDGRTRIPANRLLARAASNIRAWESMAKLGGAVISAVTDLPLYASEMRYQGRSLLASLGEGIAGLVKGRGSAEQREILASLGVFFDSMRGELTSRFSANDDLGGRMSRLQGLFFKVNGLAWWTDTMRASAALAMSHRLALHRETAWGVLGDDLRRTLGLFGIDGEKWNIIRAAATDQADGRAYLTPDAVEALPDEAFAPYLVARDIEATPARVRDLRDEIAGQLRQYVLDRMEFAVINPDARTRAVMRQGTRPGTIDGELLRFIGQFKAFPIAVLQKAVGREVYGRGTDADTLVKALRSGNGEFLGLAQLIVWSTIFGYGAMSAKDLLKGRTPRPPDDPKTWLAAMAQGGAFGIYGDFLFGEANRMGGGIVASLAGPVLGGGTEAVFDVWTRLRDGDDAAAATFRHAINNTPFLNLFYTRMVLDYAILYRIQESMNPGYLRRLERRVERENRQGFIVRPSEVAR